jgi:uncharacterized protein YggT (Ycf19 family)
MNNIVYFITVTIEALLVFRAVFKLFGASATTVIVEWLYKVTEPLIQPFQSIFHVSYVGKYLIEWSTIVALVVVGVVSFLLTELINLLTVRLRK